MANPSIYQVGTLSYQATGATNLTPTCPADITAGILLLLPIANRNNTSEGYTFSGITGWSLAGSYQGAAPQQYIYYKIADGTEGSGVVTCICGNASGDRHQANVISIAGADVSSPGLIAGVASKLLVTATTVDGQDITSVYDDSLLLNFIACNLQPGQGTLGDVGSGWTEGAFMDASSQSPQVSIQKRDAGVAALYDGGSKGGFTSANWSCVGMAVKGLTGGGGGSISIPFTGYIPGAM